MESLVRTNMIKIPLYVIHNGVRRIEIDFFPNKTYSLIHIWSKIYGFTEYEYSDGSILVLGYVSIQRTLEGYDYTFDQNTQILFFQKDIKSIESI